MIGVTVTLRVMTDPSSAVWIILIAFIILIIGIYKEMSNNG